MLDDRLMAVADFAAGSGVADSGDAGNGSGGHGSAGSKVAASGAVAGSCDIADGRSVADGCGVVDSWSVADVGTDHGYLAMELYRRNPDRRIIATDKNAGPCRAARKTLGEAGVATIEVRQGDGLAALAPGEVDMVCIAGMGGKLIRDILAGQPEVFAGLKAAVLQPQTGADVLGRWLYEMSWHIEDEELVQADGRLYRIILALPGQAEMPGDLALKLGPVLLAKRPPLFAQYVAEHLATARRILEGQAKGRQAEKEKLEPLRQEVAALEALL